MNTGVAMKQSSREQRLLALSFVFVAIPFAFALIRAVRTGYDLRYIWTAVASLLGAVMAMRIGKAYSSTRRGMVVWSAGAFVVATLCAIVTALFLGASVNAGSMLVGSAFGFCCAVSRVLYSLARSRA
jgi:hypothetical protein